MTSKRNLCPYLLWFLQNLLCLPYAVIISQVDNAQCADSVVRNAIERTPYIVVLKFHVFILISKSFNFRSPLDRILRYLTKTWFYTLNFKKNSCWWLSIAYWVIENDSVSDTKEHIFVGPLELKILSSLKQMSLTKYNWMPLFFGTH